MKRKITKHGIRGLLCLAALGCLATNGLSQSFNDRQRNIRNMLISTNIRDNSDIGYRGSWMYYHASLAEGKNISEANDYFANSSEVKPGEWESLLYIATYLKFKDTHLTNAAKTRLLDVIDNFTSQNGGGENHPIVWACTYVLTDQALGYNRGKHAAAVTKIKDWVKLKVANSYWEVNSPHYLERSLIPLVNLYDYTNDPELKLYAQIAIDQMVADAAVHSIKGVRGGPWHRAFQVGTTREITDGTQDGLYVASYVLFGNTPLPGYKMNDQILGYGIFSTTSYQAPALIKNLANDLDGRGTYVVKGRRNLQNGEVNRDENQYFFMTPSHTLASFQDRPLHDDYYQGSAPDWSNVQVWEVSFSDAKKILGAKKKLTDFKGSEDLPHKPNMQYKNVLFFSGDWADYNNNLGLHERETSGSKTYHFYRVTTSEGNVYIGIIDYISANAGILEVGEARDYSSWSDFKNKIKATASTLSDGGKKTTYTSTKGDVISYNYGSATVNGNSFQLTNYPAYSSPYMNSEWGSRVLTIEYGGKKLKLDVSGTSPKRELTDDTTPSPQQTPFGGTARIIPGTIEAEDYDVGGENVAYYDSDSENKGGKYRSDAVDIETSSQGGYSIGYLAAGEWLEYTVDVNESTTYNIEVGVASKSGSGTIDLNFDEGGATGNLNAPNTGDWQNWTTVTKEKVALQSGKQVLRLNIVSPGMNVDYIKLTKASSSTGCDEMTVTASRDDGNVPANTLDGNLNTRWSAQGNGQWIQYDFGCTKTIDTVKIAFYRGNTRTTTFDIQGSQDGTTFSSIKTGLTSSGTTLGLETFDIPTASVKSVRMVGYGNSNNSWNSLTEVEFVETTTNARVAGSASLKFQKVNLVDKIHVTNLIVYPNPASDHVTISTSTMGKVNLEIYSILGKLVHLNTGYNLGEGINISEFNSGLYYAKIMIDGEHLTKRFIVN